MSEANPQPEKRSILLPLAIAGASAALAIALTFTLRPATSAPDFVQFLGRFHTLAIHLPIGVLLLVAAAEALTLSPRLRSRIDPALGLALPFLVVTAAAAFALGLMLARGGGFPPRLVALHRGFTLGAVVGSAACLVAWTLRQRAAYRAVLGASVLLLTVGAHFGGSMTRGESYLGRYAPRFLQPLLGAPPAAAPAPENAAPLVTAEPLVFADVLLPMLKQRCVECHGPGEAKGGLRLDSFAALTKGGEHGPVVVAGRGGGSLLIERMTLPAGNDERMPPDEKPAPSADEIQLARWWIDRGATESTRVRDGVVPDGARAVLSKAALISAPTDTAAPPPAPEPVAPPPASPSSAPAKGAATSASAGPRLVWRDVVQPILVARCAGCHGDAKQKGKLRVDSLEALLAGGKGGAAIVPGNPSSGTLLARAHLPPEDDKHMPPAKEPQLDVSQVELVAWWIANGANATLATGAMPARLARASAASAPKAKAIPAVDPAPTASAEPARPPPPSPAPVTITRPVALYAELVAPILKRRCGECHLGEHLSGGFQIDNMKRMLAERDVVPGKPDESPLLQRMLLPTSSEDRMPPVDKPQPTPSEIDAVRIWIARGASLDQTLGPQEIPGDLLSAVELHPTAAPGSGPSTTATSTPAAVAAPATIPPARGSGCATCAVGGEREREAPTLSLSITALLALACVGRRARRRNRRTPA